MSKISEKKVKEIIKDLEKYQSLNNKKHQASYYYNAKNTIVNSETLSTDLIKEFLDIYSKVKKNVSVEEVETDDRAITEVERDENGKIQYYKFEIFRKDSPTLRGKLDRKEMELIYSLYSTYGQNLTQKIVSRNFPEYTFVEFKRILKAFNIYKASSPFPIHLLEELSEEELYQRTLREKENNITRRLEKDELKEANKLINKLVKENQEFKNQLNSINNIKVDLSGYEEGAYLPSTVNSDMSIVIHLSDLHIGSKCESNTLYPNKWDKEELERRLEILADKIYELGHFDTLILNLLGDNLDGMDNQTARRDHIMPQNMDNMEQVSTFIEVMTKFILRIRQFANKVKIYSVKEGNHDGIVGYVSSLALINVIQNIAPEIESVLFKDFIGQYSFKGHKYLICHGKDSKFMKRGLPLNLDERSKVMIYEWLEANGIHGDNIHFIKGDLHSNALNSCKRFDYRNVLSLFGASDYSNYNYSRNSYGVSYDLFIGNTRTLGTFENF